ncbi:hypothetical protein LXL04_007480 [Taraxacum kok-saghyz]
MPNLQRRPFNSEVDRPPTSSRSQILESVAACGIHPRKPVNFIVILPNWTISKEMYRFPTKSKHNSFDLLNKIVDQLLDSQFRNDSLKKRGDRQLLFQFKNQFLERVKGYCGLVGYHRPPTVHYQLAVELNPKGLLDIRYNGCHVETTNDDHKEYLNIRKVISGNKNVFEILPVLFSGLYYTNIRMVESYVIENKRCDNTFKVWHDRLDHPGSIMMRRVIETSNGQIS